MRSEHSLSVIIITRDEADRIRACLESVSGLADEILVFDAASSDGTVDICREYTDKVFVTADWPGWGAQKQRALGKATCEWVLRIDADERVSEELRAEIETLMSRKHVEETAFRIRWSTYVFGRYLTHGECGVGHLHLFRREGASFTSVVHEEIAPAPGSIGHLEGRLLHHAHRDYHHLLEKLADYACYAAGEAARSGKRGSVPKAFVRARWRFFKVYILRGGFLDGWRGLVLARVYSQYVFNKHAALWAESYPSQPAEGLSADVDGRRLREGRVPDGQADLRELNPALSSVPAAWRRNNHQRDVVEAGSDRIWP